MQHKVYFRKSQGRWQERSKKRKQVLLQPLEPAPREQQWALGSSKPGEVQPVGCPSSKGMSSSGEEHLEGEFLWCIPQNKNKNKNMCGVIVSST
jgi:hypothetical protein